MTANCITKIDPKPEKLKSMSFLNWLSLLMSLDGSISIGVALGISSVLVGAAGVVAASVLILSDDFVFFCFTSYTVVIHTYILV